MPPASSRLVLGPFNRVEGDLEVTLEIRDGQVAAARVNAPLYRGFEQILEGRAPLDALAIAPRICGICSVSQSMAAAAALRQAAGIRPTRNGRLAANLVHAAENIADHLTHGFVFFLPDLGREAYAGRPWHPHAARAWGPAGEASATVLRLRARLLHVVGLLAGKWPHTLAIQPGGTTVPVDAGTKARLLSVLADVRRGLESQVFGGLPLEAVAALATPADLDRLAGGGTGSGGAGDFARFLEAAADLDLYRLGRATDRFLSFGAYEGTTGEDGAGEDGAGEDGAAPLLPAGLWEDGGVRAVDEAAITEDTAHAWMEDAAPTHPRDGAARPVVDKPGAYTWCKAPRLDGRPVEVGALARQVIAGHPLLTALVAEDGGSVAARVVARFVETARLLPAMEGWVRALAPTEPFCAPAAMPHGDGQGAGLVEAARGALGHWLTVSEGRIARYQIIAPTTWNFSPRDAAGVPGPLEQALVGVPATSSPSGAAAAPLAVQHIVRSFDPCMVCTVH